MTTQQLLPTAGGTRAAGVVATIVNDDHRSGFGDFLLQARQRRGVSLEQIADRTKVSSRNLRALEQGRVEVLPGGVYRRAIMRAYAASVGLDPEIVLERFTATFGARGAEGMPGIAVPEAPAPRSHGRALSPTVIANILVAGILAIGLAFWAGSWDPWSVPSQANAAPSRNGGAASPIEIRSAHEPLPVAPAATTATFPVDRQREPASSESARLTVVSIPAGARVTVDGIGWGTTPLTIQHLPPGQKRVRVTKDGYQSRELFISLGHEGGSPATLRLALPARAN